MFRELGLRLSFHLPPGTFHPLTLYANPLILKGSLRMVLGSLCPQRWAQAGSPLPGAAVFSLCPSPGPLSVSREKQGSTWQFGRAHFYNICRIAR